MPAPLALPRAAPRRARDSAAGSSAAELLEPGASPPAPPRLREAIELEDASELCTAGVGLVL